MPKIPRKRFRGLPPPADFDLDTLPPTALLSAREVASVLRVAIGTVDSWRAMPSHPLHFIWLQGHVRYTARDLRAYIALHGGKPRGPGRPRRRAADCAAKTRGETELNALK